jgi:hypothetical protein
MGFGDWREKQRKGYRAEDRDNRKRERPFQQCSAIEWMHYGSPVTVKV